ncbi:MAG: TetR/AcrR family transcriptional regulator [Bacteroidota bacterium]
MGRKPTAKVRKQNPVLKERWAAKVSPLLLENGIRQYTMDDIVQALDCSKATLYKYFAQKRDLVEAVVQQKVQQIAVFAPILRDTERPYMQRYDEAVSAASLEMAGISTTFLDDLKQLYPKLWDLVRNLQDLAFQALTDFYQEGQERGLLNPDLTPEVLALTDKLFIIAVSDPDQLSGQQIDLKTAFDAYQLTKRKGIFHS